MAYILLPKKVMPTLNHLFTFFRSLAMRREAVLSILLLCLLICANQARAVAIFFEDFDGSGPGFGGDYYSSPFESWSIGGEPIDAGHWDLFYPDYDPTPNLTQGSGRYAGVRSLTFDYMDTLSWMVSPIIDVTNFQDLNLSIELYYDFVAYSVDIPDSHYHSEDRVGISILSIGEGSYTIDNLGEHIDTLDPFRGTRSWDIPLVGSPYIQLCFSWYSSSGPPDYDRIQLDNILLSGDARPVPEPSTLLLLSSAIVGLAGWKRKSKK